MNEILGAGETNSMEIIKKVVFFMFFNLFLSTFNKAKTLILTQCT